MYFRKQESKRNRGKKEGKCVGEREKGKKERERKEGRKERRKEEKGNRDYMCLQIFITSYLI